MSKNHPPSKKDRPRIAASPAPNNTNTPSLAQLKTTMESNPGLIKNSMDARKYLEGKNYLLCGQGNAITTLATVLLSLVVNSGPRTLTDRVPEGTANVIKAVALLMEEAVTATYVDRITEAIRRGNDTGANGPASGDMVKTLQNNSNLLETISAKLLETTEKTNELAAKIEELHNNTISGTPRGSLTTSYRDALLSNARHAPPSTPNTPLEARLRNRLNIKACQVMIEIQTDHQDPLREAYPDAEDPISMLRQAADMWIEMSANDSSDIPQGSTIRSIKQYRPNRLLVEVNKHKTANWIQEHPDSLRTLFKNQVKVLNCMYPVVVRFMPTHFQTDPAGLCGLEMSAKLEPHSIARASWIKDPTKRAPGQRYANIKVFCVSLEAANNLIMSSPQHLGSRLRTHKDIRAPSTCFKCQQYSHFAPNCKEALPTCGKCGNDDPTHECDAMSIRCTPCESRDHQTNNLMCPERQKWEDAILMKDPETLTPYYSTAERWTWGLPQQACANTEDLAAIPSVEPQCPTHCSKPPPRQSHRQHHPKRQGTLLGSGF